MTFMFEILFFDFGIRCAIMFLFPAVHGNSKIEMFKIGVLSRMVCPLSYFHASAQDMRSKTAALLTIARF